LDNSLHNDNAAGVVEAPRHGSQGGAVGLAWPGTQEIVDRAPSVISSEERVACRPAAPIEPSSALNVRAARPAHYYRTHRNINPSGIVPLGPFLDFGAPSRR